MEPQQPQTQTYSVGRRPLDVEDYIDILRRHRSWILGPMFAGLVVGVLVAFVWPDSYTASAQLRVVPSIVSQRLVPTNVTDDLLGRLNAMYVQITSRGNLTNMIQAYNLYPTLRKRLPMEDVVEEMRKEIKLSLPTGGARSGASFAFKVSYSYTDRRLSQRVCQELVSKFLDESTRVRSQVAVSTTEFLRDQAEIAKRDLDEADQKIAEFRSRNPGESPAESQTLVGRLTAVETQVQGISESMSRVSQEKLQLETNVRVLRDRLAGLNNAAAERSPAVTQRNERLVELDRDVARLEDNLRALRETYTESYPDVQRVRNFLAAKRKEREQALLEANLAEPASAPVRVSAAQTREARDLAGELAKLQTALQSKDIEMEDLNKNLLEARGKARALQAKVDASPVSQQQLIQLMREREMAETKYGDLDHRLRDSSLASNVENRKQGETLEVLEPPIAPSDPTSPQRIPIVIGGLALGIATGAGLAAAREFRDSSLKNLKDVRVYTKLTVLGSIPLLENDFVVRRRRRLAWLGWSAAILLGVMLMAGSILYYVTTSNQSLEAARASEQR